MAQHDIEQVLAEIQTFLAANLNAQLSALDTEKADGITLKQVDSTAYHLQTLEDRVDLNDPIIVYGEADEPQMQNAGSNLAVTYFVNVWVILTDNGLDSQIVKRLFRYRRALVDTFRLKWAEFARGGEKLKIAQSSPTAPFQDLDSENNWTARAVGIRISFSTVTS